MLSKEWILQGWRCLVNPNRKNSKFFISTPIYYVNAAPHVGHLYTSLIADATSRFQSQIGENVNVFATGTDEHGTKVQQAAQSQSVPLDKYCRRISSQYKEMFDRFDVKYTHFTRTTDQRHKDKVAWFWEKLIERGHIKVGKYRGWYCDADEAFLTESQLSKSVDHEGKEILVSLESGRPVHWVEEENYKFELFKFKDGLRHWLSNEKSVRPERFRRQLLALLDEGFADSEISVSRPTKRVHWGIQVPGDANHTIYVWLDALVNYLTVGHPDCWPPTIQVVGKDILKFHGIYWPAFLLAADLELPHTLAVHSHWTVNGDKMSKSLGNVVNPLEVAKIYGSDGLRYFLLREGTPHSDSNFTDVKLLRVLNSELADTLGNLLSRCTAASVNKDQLFPRFDNENFDKYCRSPASEMTGLVESLQDEVHKHYSEMNFYKGIAYIQSALHAGNRFLEKSRPWEIKSDENHLHAILHLSMETLRICGIALCPIIPNLSRTLLNKLMVPIDARSWNHLVPSWKRGFQSEDVYLKREKTILFRRVLSK